MDLGITIDGDCHYKIVNYDNGTEVLVERYVADAWAEKFLDLIVYDDEDVEGVTHGGTMGRRVVFGELVYLNLVRGDEIKNLLISCLFE
jgi:hypothetical protein